MKIRYVVLYAVAFILLAISASAIFAIYTEAGTTLVVRMLQSAFPGTFTYNTLTGRIGNRIQFEGLTVNISGDRIEAGSAELEWHPLNMVFGRLAIDSLTLENVSIIGARKEKKPVDLSLPRLPRWFSVFRARIDRLTIRGLVYTSPDSAPVKIDTASAGILFERGALYCARLNVKHARSDVTGSVVLDLIHPGLSARLSAVFQKKTAGLDKLVVRANLVPSGTNEQAAGHLTVTAFTGNRERFGFECRIGLARRAIRIDNARLIKADQGGTLDAHAVIDLSGNRPAFDVSGKLANLDLAPEIPQTTALSGDFKASGNTDDFQGDFSFINTDRSWKGLAVRGNITGIGESIQLRDLEAYMMGGIIRGTVGLERESRTMSADLTGEGFNPATIEPSLSGNLNFRLSALFTMPGEAAARGSVKAAIHNSTFQKRPFTADIDVSFTGELVKINRLEATGSGFSLNARGTVQERVTWLARVDDASRIVPGTTGSFSGGGWVRWRDHEAAGLLSTRGSNIAWRTLRIASFDAGIQMPEGRDGPIAVRITAKKLFYSIIRSDLAVLTVNGTIKDHRISFANTFEKDRIQAIAQGAYADRAWEGVLMQMSGMERLYGTWNSLKPATIRLAHDGVKASGFSIAGPGGEMLNLDANLVFGPLAGSIDATWRNINLGRVNKVLGTGRLEGHTSGDSHIEFLKDKRLVIKSTITGNPAYSHGSTKVAGNIKSDINWGNDGLSAALSVDLGNRGQLGATAVSKEAARFDMPRQGAFHAEWSELDLAMLQPMLGAIQVKGLVSGNVDGNFLPENRFRLTGNTSLGNGSFVWQSPDQGEFTAPIKEAFISVNWDNASFRGNARMALGEFGTARADFRLPLAARLPLAVDPSGPILISARGKVNERGLITALFPGMAQETKGRVSFDVTASGAAGDPRINGTMTLRNAGAYLPSAGTDVKDINADITFSNDRILVSSFTARSGPGQISVTGNARHFRGHIGEFEAFVKGDRFQVVHLPELNTLVSPDLRITGNSEKVMVRGSLKIPEAMVSEERKERMIKPSRDVIVAGQEEEVHGLPFTLDLLVSVEMGEKVAVKAYGIDTRLAGKVEISMTGPDDIRANGTITTVQGKYEAYGVKLNVQRGTISFSGPIKEANLNILAVRWIRDPERGNVAAGVLVTGNAEKPNISLYSRPAMPDMDVLSYVVLGRPGSETGQGDTALLARAAGGLLTGGKATALQKALGLDVDVGSGQQGSGAAESIVRVGRYISPKVYVSLGRSLSGEESIFTLRYRLTRKLDIESTVGTNQTGGAIYYRVEFD